MGYLKTLIINGSPRKRTHSQMIDAMEKGLTAADSEVTTKRVYDLDIKPCLGCNMTCMKKTPGICVHKDDMDSLLPLVSQSDLLVLATPVYLDAMTGPMKTFVDRLTPILEGRMEIRKGRARHPLREGVKRGKMALLSSCGFPELETFDPLLAHVKAICRNLNREYVGAVLVTSGFVKRRKYWDKVLGMIEYAGTNLVKDGKIPDDITSSIQSLVSRDELINAANALYP